MKRLALAATLALVALPALAAPLGAPGAVRRDAKVWAAAERVRPDQLRLLETLVNIDSGTGDVEGGRKVAAVLIPRLEALGMTVETVPAEIPGLPENLVATLKGAGKGRILMIGHLDTVFEPGTAAMRPFRVDGDRLVGPGVGDEKGGVVSGVLALSILRELGFKDFRQIVFLIETSEERGSPGTRKLIDRLLADADVELNLEPGGEPDVITVWRKGSNVVRIDVKGRAAHAGVAPGDGRNAAEEVINQVAAVKDFPKTGDGTTVNLTLLNAGARNNIIPEAASATFSVRVRKKEDFEPVLEALNRSAASPKIPDTSVAVSVTTSFPPLPDNPATDALADRAAAIYAGLGLTLQRGGNGGASESALAFEAGVPALDGLGPIGGDFHSEKEWIDARSLTPRLYLLTKLLMDLGKAPPPRIK